MERMVKEVSSALVEHMADMYLHPTAPQPDPASGSLGSGAEDGKTGSSGKTRLFRPPLRPPKMLGPTNRYPVGKQLGSAP